MPNPQQPELRRSGHHAVDDDAAATKLPAQGKPGTGGDTGPVPDDNLPGHHPAEDQDKPEGDDFVAKAREVAERARAGADGDDGDETGAQRTGSDRDSATTPPSTAPVAAAPQGGGGPATEADAPSATADAVTADALAHTPAADTGAPTAAPIATAATPPRSSQGGSNPIVAIATFQWKVATFPVRVAVDVLGRIRRHL